MSGFGSLDVGISVSLGLILDILFLAPWLNCVWIMVDTLDSAGVLIIILASQRFI